MLKFLYPHIHAGSPYPAGYLLNPEVAGMSLADAESLMRQGRAAWIVDGQEEIPPVRLLPMGETPPEPNLSSPEETKS